jgi:hypothetical protein
MGAMIEAPDISRCNSLSSKELDASFPTRVSRTQSFEGSAFATNLEKAGGLGGGRSGKSVENVKAVYSLASTDTGLQGKSAHKYPRGKTVDAVDKLQEEAPAQEATPRKADTSNGNTPRDNGNTGKGKKGKKGNKGNKGKGKGKVKKDDTATEDDTTVTVTNGRERRQSKPVVRFVATTASHDNERLRQSSR